MLSESIQGAPRSTRARLCSTRFSGFTFYCAPLLALLVVCGLHRCAQAQSSSSSQSSSRRALQSRPQNGLASRRAETRQRREAQIITDTYTHRWEAYVGGTYMRFRPGPDLHNAGTGGWTLGIARYFTPRFALTADARGYYAATSGIHNPYNTYNMNFSVFPFTVGPQYRFYANRRFSINGALQGGIIYGYFDANTNGFPPELVGLYPAGITGAGIASVNFDYNLGPGLAFRVAPHVLFNGFGGDFNHNQGVLVGLVYRFGRQ